MAHDFLIYSSSLILLVNQAEFFAIDSQYISILIVLRVLECCEVKLITYRVVLPFKLRPVNSLSISTISRYIDLHAKLGDFFMISRYLRHNLRLLLLLLLIENVLLFFLYLWQTFCFYLKNLSYRQ